MKFHFILLSIISLTFGLVQEQGKQDCRDVTRTEQEPLLVLSTLNGDLLAIDPNSGEIKWKLNEEPSVKTENNNVHLSSNSVYFPDPISGHLYRLRMQENGNTNELRKLPYTIPELVTRSPCKSSDGILYSGKKSDNWFMIDPKTGKREWVMGFGAKAVDDILGYATSRAVYLGRTQYTVLMYDTTETNSKPWNITFYDYSSHTMAPEILDKYEFIHVTSSTTGKIITMNKKSGNYLWQLSDDTYKSPIVAIFILTSEGFLSVPFTTVSENVIEKVIDYSLSETKSDFQLYETVYVGESKDKKLDTFYAIPSYIDDLTPTIKKNRINLLEGPKGKNSRYDDDEIIPASERQANDKKDKNIIFFGHYEVPATETFFETISSTKSKDANNELSIIKHQPFINLYTKSSNEDESKIILNESNSASLINDTAHDENDDKASVIETHDTKKIGILKYIKNSLKSWMDHEENKVLKLLMVILIGIVITMFWYFHTTVKELRQQSQNGSNTTIRGSGNSNSDYSEPYYSTDEHVKIGKISFNPRLILGKGCEGTFVFRGTFENRDVAVKRLLPDCFTLADREVALLRESDTHENVVRYFCTESDRQFRYIAVELCSATLQDYIDGKNADNLQQLIDVKEVLYQATSGLNHLHHLNIVHRDIKPQNVLISLPDNKNRVRALISDFGLCKKVNLGKASFSKKSGITGTDGWIAAEMIRGNRVSISVDIFSMGCVYYFVLSNGQHPFGDTLKRQANILSNEYELNNLSTHRTTKQYENILARELIADMINKDPSRRPSTEAILKHPLFWREEKILSFFQDVSDRIEKLDLNNEPLRSLERNAPLVVRDDWSVHLHEEITADLRKYRGYYGCSVRCLLRALRNKKHHYHELSSDMQRILGSIPNDFIRYWIVRFSHLFSHTYHAMESCSKENIFKRYYCTLFQFTKPDYLFDETLDNHALTSQELSKPLTKEKNYSKKENKQPNSNNFNSKIKRGAYNFIKAQGKSNDVGGFITRDEMMPKCDNDEKITWKLTN